jgi:hypothetical protein
MDIMATQLHENTRFVDKPARSFTAVASETK